MRCPHCDVALLMSERQGVEIDYCPECRGVWLDRGELDKIVERSHSELLRSPSSATAPPPGSPSGDRDRDRGRDRDDDRDRSRDHDDDRERDRDRRERDRRRDGSPAPKKKRTSFIEDIFDF